MSSELKNEECIIVEDIDDPSIIDLELYKIYFNDLLNGEKYIRKKKLIEFIENKGICYTDKRFNNMILLLDEKITLDKFLILVQSNILFFKKIFENDLIIAN